MAIYISKKKGNPKPVLQEKEVTITPEADWTGEYTKYSDPIKPDEDYDGMSQVTMRVPMIRDDTLVTASQVSVPVTVYNGDTQEVNIDRCLRLAPTKDGMAYKQSYLYLKPNSYLGNATVDDVVAGKTFSSVNGIQKTGTKQFKLQEKSATPQTTVQTVTPDSGYDGLSKVNVGAIALNLQAKTATASSSQVEVTPDSGYNGLSKVTINAIQNQSKTVRATTSNQTVTPDSGYSGLSQVTVQPQTHSDTFNPYTQGDDMGQTHKYRYLNLENFTVIPTGTTGITANGTYDMNKGEWGGEEGDYWRYVNVNVEQPNPWTETTLWSNSDPTGTAMEAGTSVTLSADIDEFNYLKFTWRISKTDSTESSLLVSADEFVNMRSTNSNGIAMCARGSNSNTIYYRSVYMETYSRIRFDQTKLSGGGNTSYVIPLKVIGVKYGYEPGIDEDPILS